MPQHIATRLRWAWLAPALALASAFAGCTLAPTFDPGQPPPGLVENFSDAVMALAGQSEACAKAQPPGWTADGLVRLADHSSQWAERFGGDVTPEPTACFFDEFELQIQRVGTFGARLATSNWPDAEPLVAMIRALRVDLALANGSEVAAGEPNGADPLMAQPEVAGVLSAESSELADLALAEDQAGYLLEYLAANTEPDPDQAEQPEAQPSELRHRLIDLAKLHRQRAKAIASALSRADQADPRQAAYLIDRQTGATKDAIATEVQRIELALASHYAALPYNTGADDLLTWQLLAAHQWGAEPTAFPFYQG
ncbi:MAG: hypothetical protein FWG16_08105 [Micrococcales bacterium]|nr:hypothetical protein [Micrococcales bacterium]